MERNNPTTSHEANKSMTKELRAADHAKILEAMEALGGFTIYTEVATYLGWSDKSKVSRRNIEILRDGKIYLTGNKRLTPTNRNAQEYGIVKEGTVIPAIPEKEHYMANQTSAADYANLLIAGSKEGKLIQKDIFNSL